MTHIVGKVYDTNQANWNGLIAELDAAHARIEALEREIAGLRKWLVFAQGHIHSVSCERHSCVGMCTDIDKALAAAGRDGK